MSATATRTVRPRLKARYQKQVDDFNGAIRETDSNRTPRRCNGQHLGMFNRPPIRQMNFKWLKRLGLMQLSQLLDRHPGIVIAIRVGAKPLE